MMLPKATDRQLHPIQQGPWRTRPSWLTYSWWSTSRGAMAVGVSCATQPEPPLCPPGDAQPI